MHPPLLTGILKLKLGDREGGFKSLRLIPSLLDKSKKINGRPMPFDRYVKRKCVCHDVCIACDNRHTYMFVPHTTCFSTHIFVAYGTSLSIANDSCYVWLAGDFLCIAHANGML